MVIKVEIKIMVKDRQDRQKLTLKLDFPGNLCGAAFVFFAMFHSFSFVQVWICASLIP